MNERQRQSEALASVPFFQFHCREHWFIPFRAAARMALSLRRIGNRSARVIPVPGCGHGGWLRYLGRDREDLPGRDNVSIYDWLLEPDCPTARKECRRMVAILWFPHNINEVTIIRRTRWQNRGASMITRKACLLLTLLIGMASPVYGACDGEKPCEIENGSYYLALPDDWDGQTALPAIVFFHGHRSSGKSVMNGSVRSTFGGAGYAVIAPNGPMRPGADYRYWPGRPMNGKSRDDIAFTLAVIEDVAERISLDRDRILVSGFSAGGSMAWMIACYSGDVFAGYAPIAGALRRPAPNTDCPGGPARMLHVHGFADSLVPLEGRAIRDWHQGDVFASLDLLRNTDGCESKPSTIEVGSPFWCREWNGCSRGADIRFCLHEGGHGIPQGWAEIAKDWFEVARPPR